MNRVTTYASLTFFTTSGLVNRDNFLASKQASKHTIKIETEARPRRVILRGRAFCVYAPAHGASEVLGNIAAPVQKVVNHGFWSAAPVRKVVNHGFCSVAPAREVVNRGFWSAAPVHGYKECDY